jgi:PhnB protein
MRFSPHLIFDGQCRRALQDYQRIFGGRITTMLTYGGSPMASQFDPLYHDRIVHATLVIGEVELTGVDVFPSDYRIPQGFFVTVTIDEPQRAAKIFNSLASGGEIRMAFQPTFWSSGFGVVIDRYAVPWEINSIALVSSTSGKESEPR